MGAGLIESQLKPKSKPGQDTKDKIKVAIDSLEGLQKEEVDSIITMIVNLHTKLHNRVEPKVDCKCCGHINPTMSLFYSQCGIPIVSKP